MINIKDNGLVDARELHSSLKVKTRFTDWINRSIDSLGIIEGKDFYSKLSIGKRGGRPVTEYDLTLDSAKEVAIVSATPRSKEVRMYLIDLSNKRDNLEVISVPEAAFAFKVIQCLQFVENQKQAVENHRNTFVNNSNDKEFVYQRFNMFRNSLTGWNKEKIEEAITQYQIINHRTIKATNNTDKLNILDTPEALRVACLDVLYSEGKINNAQKFSNLVKNLATELKIKSIQKNETNLFQFKQEGKSIKELYG
jgi:phage anti-repressor protein